MRISDWSSDVCSSDLAVVAAAVRAHAGDALDGDLDGDRAGLLEGEGEGEALAFVQRLLQADQHEVVAARPQDGAAVSGNLDRLQTTHLHDVAVHLVRVQLDALGDIAGGPEQAVGITGVLYGEEGGKVGRASWRERVWQYV